MSGSGTLSGGAVWLRIGIFTVASVALSWALAPLLEPILRGITEGGASTWGLALLPAVASLPTLGAAVLAWLLPRPLPLRTAGATRPWFWCLVLFLVGAGVHLALALGSSSMNGWSDSVSVFEAAKKVWIALWVGLPSTAVKALITMVLLWGIARRAMSAARAGVVVAVAGALPGLLSLLLASALGGGFAGGTGGVPSGAAEAGILVSSVVQVAAWAVLYSGLGRLVDGRGPGARWALSAMALLPLFVTPRSGLPFVSSVELDGSLGSAIASTLASMTMVLALGALAWLLSAARPSRASTRSAATADAGA